MAVHAGARACSWTGALAERGDRSCHDLVDQVVLAACVVVLVAGEIVVARSSGVRTVGRGDDLNLSENKAVC